MPQLIFMRHGEAQSLFEAGSDSGRNLTENGRLEVQRTASMFKKLLAFPEAIIASPFTRAQQTAAIVKNIIGFEGDIETDERLLPQGRAQTLKDLLADKRTMNTVFMIGHEPSISHFVSSICANDMLSMSFETANACSIYLDSLRLMRGTLTWFIKPDIMREDIH